MIQLTKKLAAAAPAKLTNQGAIETQNLKMAYDAGQRIFSFDSNIYGHKEVKEALINLQSGKCCFCESKITHVSWGDVEHFRPKGGWVQDAEQLNTPGYYWLAYEWDNLFLACEICNEKYKKNFFPLKNNANRALSHHHNLNDEESLFVHPAHENPENFIEFNEEVPRAIDDNLRGKVTIEKTGIDREILNERRREKLADLQFIYDLANGCPDTNPEFREQAWEGVKLYYNKSNMEETEYSSMLKSFFRANPLP